VRLKGNRCQVCDHADRASIELGLANKVPIRVLGKRYGIHHDAVYRHGRNHMAPELHAKLMTRGRMDPVQLENLREIESEGLLHHLVATRARMYGHMDAAEQQNDYKAAATIGDKVVKTCETIAKLLGDIRTGTVNVHQSVLVLPEFHALRTSIMQALRAHPQARADVVKALQHFESPDLPNVESEAEHEAAQPQLAKARDVTRGSRAKRAVIEGESHRVGDST
jgi:hypothetical protein